MDGSVGVRGDVGFVGHDDDRVAGLISRWNRATISTPVFESRLPVDDSPYYLPRADVAWVYQGATGDVIKALVDAGAKGVIIAGAGAGATAGTQGEGIRYAIGKGVFVVTTTRAGAGRIATGRPRPGDAPVYSIRGDDLTPVKARILLMLAIATTKDGRTIQRMFSEY